MLAAEREAFVVDPRSAPITPHLRLRSTPSPMSAFSQSIGTGKMIVEFFSAAISTSVCR